MAEAKEVEKKKTVKKAVSKEKPAKKEIPKDVEPVQEPVKAESEAPVEKKASAKAGKKSAKAIAEAEEKAEKEERMKEDKPAEAKPKHQQKPPRSKLERRSKKYRKSAELIEKNKEYKLEEALALACKTSTTKFDATVELHVRLDVDPKQADQNIRDSVVLPSGTGKTIRVAVFADDENAKKAKSAGADIAGNDDFLALLDKGEMNFDVLIAMPALMAKLAKYAKILGPKGLMPNPKSGTVTNDVVKAIEQSKAGKVEYRVDSNGIIHIGLGKVSFGEAKLKLNADELMTSIKQNKPASVKSAYMKSVFVTTSMGPSIQVDLSNI